ncbi:MAG: phage shock protein E [Arcticibacterium sp.]|jgi:phage shock protein E
MFDFIKNLFGNNSEEMKEIIENGAVIIDVRTPGEFAGGHPAKAVNIPLDTLESKLSKIKGYKKPIVLCCASGMRSARAKSFLQGKGIENLHDAGAWSNIA